ncbi:hypothetical protein J4G57_15250, partial [Aeromonas caviae]|uniref:hypothetical protein n=1 Tax=Aeromonas caviae TaxID=648 RepID=UPI001BD4301B
GGDRSGGQSQGVSLQAPAAANAIDPPTNARKQGDAAGGRLFYQSGSQAASAAGAVKKAAETDSD